MMTRAFARSASISRSAAANGSSSGVHEDASHQVDDADRLAGARAADDSCRGPARRRGSSPAAAASAAAGCSRALPSCPRRDCPTSSRRRRSSRIVSAMSPVTPKPAAEFSTLAMTKSMLALLDERGDGAPRDLAPGLAEDVADEEDPHGSRPAPECGCSRPRRSSMRGSVTRSSPATQRGVGARRVERAVEPTTAREPAERALGEVKRRLAPVLAGPAACAPVMSSVLRRRRRSRASAGCPARSTTISMPVGGFDDVEGGVCTRRRSGLALDGLAVAGRRGSWIGGPKNL